MGNAKGNHADGHDLGHVQSRPMYEGRGLQAPMTGQTNHKSGSQGKH